MKVDKVAVGNRIRLLRIENNMTMQELANTVGASGKSTVNEWEKGRSLPADSSIRVLASALYVTKSYLLYGDLRKHLETMIVSTDEKKMILRIRGKLNESRRSNR